MKIKNILRSNAGVSILQMLVVMGMIGAASVSILKLTENSYKVAKNNTVKDEITQFHNQVNEILKNPNNCEATLSGSGLNSSIPVVYQVLNGVSNPKYTVEAIPADPKKISIASMTVISVDTNGTNGSGSIATLRVGFRKPNVKGHIGGQVLNKEITIDANLCDKNFIEISSTASVSTLLSQCTDLGSQARIVDGPHTWGSKIWAVCQNCANASTTKIIRSCKSQGSSGVDVGSVSELNCTNQGGIWNPNTSSCNTDAIAAAASCVSLGGTYDIVTKKCNSITVFVASMPSCVISVEDCTGMYPNQQGTLKMAQTGTENYSWFYRRCWTKYYRSGAGCAALYNEYEHCGHFGPRVHDHEYCNTEGENAGATCAPSSSDKHQDCFHYDGYDCETTGSETRTRPKFTTIYIKKCCK